MTFCLKMKSDYSFLSSTITIDDAISFCKQNNSQYCALIDNNMFGALEFYNKCLLNSLKPILGVELNVLYNEQVYPLIFIAKSEMGYKNISKLTSIAYRYKKEPIEFKTLSLYSQDVIVVISSEDSYLTNLILNNDIFEANEYIENLKNIYKELYFGVYRYKGHNENLLNKLKEYTSQLNIMNIAMQYATHKSEKDTVILNLLNCINKNINANKEFLSIPSIAESYLKSNELLKIYYDSEELNNLLKMSSSINLKINKINFSLPVVYKDVDENEKLKELALSSLKQKGFDNNQKYVDRVNYELDIISKMGFANYYLVVADYVNYAKNNDIPVGPARGSGAASLVAFLLNITIVDPLKYDLLFERFLNPSRISYPDFDIDFADIKRDEVIAYLKDKYGYNHVAHIATFATFGVKSAIRDIAKLLKTSNDEIDYLIKSLSANPISINDEYRNNKKFKDILEIHGNFKTICSLASQIEGLKRQVGLHAAGMILSNENLENLLPCFENDENSFAIQYDYLTAEKLGLIKMDFLGLKNLTIIDYCIKKINSLYNKNLTFESLNYDDKSTYNIISSGQTLGIFQLESSGINNVIHKLKPSCFDDVVALLALYRPGPMDMIPTYIERKHGKEFSYLDDSLIPILKNTYGIIVYQEQIMQICQKVANLTLGDADILRRAISKKNINVIKSEKDKFIKGCLANNFDIAKANKLFEFIEKFASYGFNKAHSVGYAIISSVMAYLKANYRTVFYEALLNINNESGERKKQLFYEAKKQNIVIKHPNVLTSALNYTCDENSILFGLSNITSIKNNIASKIINERNIALFSDINDFVIRMALNDISIETIQDLTYAGALDCFNIERSKIIANLSNLYTTALMFKGSDYKPNTYKNEKYSSIGIPVLYFDDEETDFLKKEYEMLEIYITTHPLTMLKQKQTKQITDISSIDQDGYYNIIGKIMFIENKKGKDNKDIIIFKIEDDTSIMYLREYNNTSLYKGKFKKGDLILANITIKNKYCYINTLTKLEVNEQ